MLSIARIKPSLTCRISRTHRLWFTISRKTTRIEFLTTFSTWIHLKGITTSTACGSVGTMQYSRSHCRHVRRTRLIDSLTSIPWAGSSFDILIWFLWKSFSVFQSLSEFAVSTRILRDEELATRNYHGNDFKVNRKAIYLAVILLKCVFAIKSFDESDSGKLATKKEGKLKIALRILKEVPLAKVQRYWELT